MEVDNGSDEYDANQHYGPDGATRQNQYRNGKPGKRRDDPNGRRRAYRRKMVVFEETPEKSGFKASFSERQAAPAGVVVSEVVRAKEDYQMVLNPGHPDADPVTGYVIMPNINTMNEIADMVVARRAYDANVTAISNTKSMILKALEIGK